MPDRRRHRGPHPEDERLFAPGEIPKLRAAVRDYSWLLGRGYSPRAALKLVGDRFQLTARQRTAVDRAAAPDEAVERRAARMRPLEAASPGELLIDAYNVLITVESALSGGFLLRARDSTLRDLASLHGSYRIVEETEPALELIGEVLAEHGVERALWCLDRPVSNSGRLAKRIEEVGARRGWGWRSVLEDDPDGRLLASRLPVATSDSRILDGASAWCNLARTVVEERIPGARILALDPAGPVDPPSGAS